MAYGSLSEFVTKLAAAGELKRIRVAVDPVLEITEIADREMKSPGGGKALLFENCHGAKYPLLINAYGSVRRMALALGVADLESIAADLHGILNAKPPTSLREALTLLGTAMELRHAKPSRGSAAAATEELPGLSALPIQQCWPQDAGRFITLPMVITRDPETGARNVGMYRMQVLDEWTTFLHWQLHKTGARHWRRYCELRQRMPVSVALGGDPTFAFCATAPLTGGAG